MSAVLDVSAESEQLEQDERFRAHEADDMPVSVPMPFDPANPDTWVLAKLARRHGIGVWIASAIVLIALACFGRWLLR